ncbi:general substrate transporter [Phakopsora pachyrhizi]|uniref:General substrate transporter n=1 Tax=Phakopsora pachyrhizi TaxID=170000 RepID=A0AAV0AGE8_PHAPC|nr:general substrate transporter [Phakopsora pachyrhizi]CAH7666752.1 general substrate transporter [Phakopsora pachyrhizi]
MSLEKGEKPKSISINSGDVDAKAKLMGLAMVTFAAFGGFLYGYDASYISGTKEIKNWLHTFGERDANGEYSLSTSNNSLVTSTLPVGTFAGALLAYPVGDILGRRWGIISSCAIFCVGVALQTASTTVPIFAVGRVFAGLGIGLTSCLVPMYQSECAPKWIRGAVVSCYQWAINIGLLVAAIVVQLTKDINNSGSYRIPLGLEFIWAFILSLGLFLLPESPKYLIFKGCEQEAKVSIGRLLSVPTDSHLVQEELDEVNESLKAERDLARSSYIDCFRSGPGKYRLRTLTGMSLQALQQLSGINFIIYFGTSFFKRSGINNAFLIAIIINLVIVVMALPGVWLVDKTGRRSLLLVGSAVMTLCEFIIAIIGVKVDSSEVTGQRTLVAFVCIYIGAFAATWGPIVWVVTSEIYPLAIRAKAMSISTASNWAWNFIIAYSTPYLVDSGPGKAGLNSKVFFIWGAFCASGFLFTFLFVPETKGLSLEQVDQLYKSDKKTKP